MLLIINSASHTEAIASGTVTPPNQPRVFSIDGINELSIVNVGHQVLIKGTFHNSANYSQPFIDLYLVESENGTVTAIGIVGGKIDVGQTLKFHVSWLPEQAGKYTIRQFDLSSLDDPSILATPSQTSIQVI